MGISLGQRFYNIDGFDLDMGEGHLLAYYQRKCPLFNRINPYLAKLQNEVYGDWIIDVGANVGDTLASMVKHTKAGFLCIEPTEEYYKLLSNNAANIIANSNKIVRLEQSYVTINTGIKYKSKVSEGGTAIMVPLGSGKKINNRGIPVSTLLEICNKHSIAISDIGLIKTSTSGYDADVVMSMGDSLSDISPLLYVETSMGDIDENHIDEQYEAYTKMDSFLFDMGYKDVFIFDNFGNYLCHSDIKCLRGIHRYLNVMAKNKSTRSFYYIYVLFCKKQHVQSCNTMCENYMRDVERGKFL